LAILHYESNPVECILLYLEVVESGQAHNILGIIYTCISM